MGLLEPGNESEARERWLSLPWSLHGLEADDGYVYSFGRDGCLYRRRAHSITLNWSLAESHTIPAYHRAAHALIDNLLANTRLIGPDAGTQLRRMVYGGSS